MSTIAKPGKAIALTSLAAIAAAREQAANLLATATAAEADIKAKTENEVKDHINGLLPKIGKVLGRDFNLGELAGVVSAMSKDKPLFPANAPKAGPVALTEDKRTALSAFMLGRAASVKLGQTPKTISSICTEVGCSPQTAPNYKPTQAEVEALPGDKEVPAEFYVADEAK